MIPGWTVDRPAPGVEVAQPARGFRYGAEAFWIAGFALEESTPAAAADLGTGSGVIALLLAAAGVDATGYELRGEWGTGWAHTLARSKVSGRIRLVHADVSAPIAGRFPLVVSNPPFFARAAGPIAEDPWRAAARTESTAPLARFVETALSMLEPGGRFCVVVPREREFEVARAGAVRRLVRVGARRSLVELQPGWVGPCAMASHDEEDPRVVGWTRRFRAGA